MCEKIDVTGLNTGDLKDLGVKKLLPDADLGIACRVEEGWTR
jgi:hypothetical protein